MQLIYIDKVQKKHKIKRNDYSNYSLGLDMDSDS